VGRKPKQRLNRVPRIHDFDAAPGWSWSRSMPIGPNTQDARTVRTRRTRISCMTGKASAYEKSSCIWARWKSASMGVRGPTEGARIRRAPGTCPGRAPVSPAQLGTTGGMYFSQPSPKAPAANVVLIETYNNASSRGGKDKKKSGRAAGVRQSNKASLFTTMTTNVKNLLLLCVVSSTVAGCRSVRSASDKGLTIADSGNEVESMLAWISTEPSSANSVAA